MKDNKGKKILKKIGKVAWGVMFYTFLPILIFAIPIHTNLDVM